MPTHCNTLQHTATAFIVERDVSNTHRHAFAPRSWVAARHLHILTTHANRTHTDTDADVDAHADVDITQMQTQTQTWILARMHMHPQPYLCAPFSIGTCGWVVALLNGDFRATALRYWEKKIKWNRFLLNPCVCTCCGARPVIYDSCLYIYMYISHIYITHIYYIYVYIYICIHIYIYTYI